MQYGGIGRITSRKTLIGIVATCVLAAGLTTSSVAAGTETWAFNAGGSAYTGPAGTFLADQPASATDSGYSGGSSRSFAPSLYSHNADPEMLSTVRTGRSFRYEFPGIGAGDYVITLEFSEQNNVGAGGRLFDVFVNNAPLLDDLDVYAESGLRNHLTKTFTVTVVGEDLTVLFESSIRTAIVSAITVEPVVVPPPSTSTTTSSTSTTSTTTTSTTSTTTTAPPDPSSCSLTASAVSLDHGTVQVLPLVGPDNAIAGASSYRQLVITNTGADAETIIAITSDNDDFMILDPWLFPVSVDSGASVTVITRFRPEVYGPQTATINISTSCAEPMPGVEFVGAGDDSGVFDYPSPRYDSIWVPRTASHDAAGITAGQGISSNAVGVIIGHSTTRHTAHKLVTSPDLFPTSFTFVNIAEIGADAPLWATRNAVWVRGVDKVVAEGHAPEDVEVAWISLVDAGPGDDPVTAQFYNDLNTVIDRLPSFFPNITMVYVSSSYFGGHSTRAIDGLQKNSEPLRWAGTLAIEQIVEDRDGQTTPWVGWGPYTWAPDQEPRADGLIWTSDLFTSDGVHLTQAGREQDAQMLYDFFINDPTSPWYSLPT